MFGFGKSKEEKAADKAEKERQKNIKAMPAEFFDGLDKNRSVYTQGGRMGQNITPGTMKRDMAPGQIVCSVEGFWTPKPVDGDYLKVNMRSGNVAIFKFTGLNPGWTADRDKHPFGPRDYFEGQLIWICYEQELGTYNRDTITFS